MRWHYSDGRAFIGILSRCWLVAMKINVKIIFAESQLHQSVWLGHCNFHPVLAIV